MQQYYIFKGVEGEAHHIRLSRGVEKENMFQQTTDESSPDGIYLFAHASFLL